MVDGHELAIESVVIEFALACGGRCQLRASECKHLAEITRIQAHITLIVSAVTAFLQRSELSHMLPINLSKPILTLFVKIDIHSKETTANALTCSITYWE